jgi:hypothetical protein
MCLEYRVISSDLRKIRVAVCYTQYVAAMMRCANDAEK